MKWLILILFILTMIQAIKAQEIGTIERILPVDVPTESEFQVRYLITLNNTNDWISDSWLIITDNIPDWYVKNCININSSIKITEMDLIPGNYEYICIMETPNFETIGIFEGQCFVGDGKEREECILPKQSIEVYQREECDLWQEWNSEKQRCITAPWIWLIFLFLLLILFMRMFRRRR